VFLVDCRRCGIPYDADEHRLSQAGIDRLHGHGREPRGWAPGPYSHPGEAAGTKVRLLHPLPPRTGLTPGTILTVVSTSPEHHSQNGGGYDISTVSDDGTIATIWSRWLEVVD
jgi:hypothetical protein